MTPEIRKAALRIAAKTALVVVTVGCSGGGSSTKSTPPTNTGGASASGAVVACDAHLGALALVDSKDQLAAGDPLKERMDVYGKVFANAEERNAPRTQECCTQELATNGAGSKLRWECCSALPAQADPAACTPWGPPCPPEMPALA